MRAIVVRYNVYTEHITVTSLLTLTGQKRKSLHTELSRHIVLTYLVYAHIVVPTVARHIVTTTITTLLSQVALFPRNNGHATM